MQMIVAVGPHSPIGYNPINMTRDELLLQLARIPPSAITEVTEMRYELSCSWPAFPHRL